MRALLDVNVVIALLDPDHAFHESAHAWWSVNGRAGWASCPIVENGVVRMMSHPEYSPRTAFTPGDLISHLRAFAGQTNHEFWLDDISILDNTVFAVQRIHGPRQLTDLYLLALAVKHKGRLATFDKGIQIAAVNTAKTANLVVV